MQKKNFPMQLTGSVSHMTSSLTLSSSSPGSKALHILQEEITMFENDINMMK